MILPNHPRARFALRVLLTITAPAWVLALIPVGIAWLMVITFWEAAGSLIDPPPTRLSGKRAP
jgi:hypothetical protein